MIKCVIVFTSLVLFCRESIAQDTSTRTTTPTSPVGQVDQSSSSASLFRESRPSPDPTALTTQQLLREVGALREVINTRLDASDKAIAVLQELAGKEPSASNVLQRVEALEKLGDTRLIELRGLIQDLRDAVKSGLDNSALQREKLQENTDERFQAVNSAIDLARENAGVALTAALTNLKELQAAALDAANQARDKAERDTAARFTSISATIDQINTALRDLPNKREVEIQFGAFDQRLREVQGQGEKAIADTNGRLELALNALQRSEGASANAGNFVNYAGIFIGALVGLVGVGLALSRGKTAPEPTVVYKDRPGSSTV